ITSVPTATQFTYTNPIGGLAGSSGGNASLVVPVSSATITAATSASVGTNVVATITTAAPHGFVVGQNVTISNVTGVTTYNGTFTITAVLSPTQFQYILPVSVAPG